MSKRINNLYNQIITIIFIKSIACVRLATPAQFTNHVSPINMNSFIIPNGEPAQVSILVVSCSNKLSKSKLK